MKSIISVLLASILLLSLAIPVSASNISVASSYSGLHESKNSKVLEKFIKVNPRRTPWCAAFANAVLKANGKKGTGSNKAISFSKYGQKVSIKTARKGDIVIVRTGGYHVGFFDSISKGKVILIGGNQSNSVKKSSFAISRVISIRRG